MSDVTAHIMKLKEEIKTREKEFNQAQGALNALEKEMADMGFSTIEEMKEYKVKLSDKIKTMEERVDTLLAQVEETMRDIEDD